jgi:hypothetical protein
MRKSLRFGWAALLSIGMALAGINWKAVWLEPHIPVILHVGEVQPYKVMGLNGGNIKADLTTHRDLRITSSDTDVLEIDREQGVLRGKNPGHVEIRISFSEATAIVRAWVKEAKTGSPAPSHQ